MKRKHDSNNATVYMQMYQYYNVQDDLVHYSEHTRQFLTAEPFRNKILLLQKLITYVSSILRCAPCVLFTLQMNIYLCFYVRKVLRINFDQFDLFLRVFRLLLSLFLLLSLLPLLFIPFIVNIDNILLLLSILFVVVVGMQFLSHIRCIPFL